METFLTILMALGIYVVLPLIVAAVVCGAVIWRAKVRAERTEEVATTKEVEELVHHPAKR
jgi:type II secretory pathway component PulK